jgi:uncharacterized protein
MPIVTTHAPGAPCWIDLMSADPARATEFYSTLFGSTSETAGEESGRSNATSVKPVRAPEP